MDKLSAEQREAVLERAPGQMKIFGWVGPGVATPVMLLLSAAAAPRAAWRRWTCRGGGPGWPGSSIDLFSLWLVFLLAVGFAVASKKATGSALWGVAIPWILIVLVKVGWSAIFSRRFASHPSVRGGLPVDRGRAIVFVPTERP